jgi:mRNA interferase MazF
MVKEKYIPERGDVVWLNFNPTKGHEQKGNRPAFVVSPHLYNKKTGMALVCPITSSIKGYPFEEICKTGEITGAILIDQIRCVDWNARKIRRITKASGGLVVRVLSKIRLLVG